MIAPDSFRPVLGFGHPDAPGGLVLGPHVVMAGTLASRPGAAIPGRLYLATDDGGGTLYRDSGSAWAPCGLGAGVSSSGWDVAEVADAPSAQRLGFWEPVDGYAATADLTRYTMSGGITFSRDGTTGRNRVRISGATANGTVRYVRLDDTVSQMRAAENWRFAVLTRRETAPVGGTQDMIHGLRNGIASGLQDGIYLRATNTGNYFLVCRSAGVESTVDLGATPSTTGQLLEFRISGGGASVQGYRDGAAVGSPIATNIPAGLLTMFPGLFDSRAAGATTAAVFDLFGWGWEGDLL